jgi:hypothetical protein
VESTSTVLRRGIHFRPLLIHNTHTNLLPSSSTSPILEAKPLQGLVLSDLTRQNLHAATLFVRIMIKHLSFC